MERDIFKKLSAWTTSERRKPLILQGARQVGKTFALNWLGKNHYQNVAYCNFEEDKTLSSFFKSSPPKNIIESLASYLKTEISPRKTLLIFDEVQECSEALNSLKYFQEKYNEYHIVAAGSLLGVKLAHLKSFPVGKVNFLNLYPLSFVEFLDALGEDRLRRQLDEKIDLAPINLGLHERLISLLRQYYFVGGMPEAVSQYVKKSSAINLVREIQIEILKSYELDFVKHTHASEAMKMSQVWDLIPSQLAKENKKFVFSALGKSARGREYIDALQWLWDAGMIHESFAVSKPSLPLKGYSDRSAFKVFLLDVGLLASLAEVEIGFLSNTTFDVFEEFKGAFTENYVAQQLISKGETEELFYWRSENTAEVDFLYAKNQKVWPLEVKAGINTKSKSLKIFGEKYKVGQLCRCSLLNFDQAGEVMNYPLYAVHRFPELGGGL